MIKMRSVDQGEIPFYIMNYVKDVFFFVNAANIIMFPHGWSGERDQKVGNV